MKILGRFLITTLAVIVAEYILPGITFKNNYTPLIVALVLGLLNTFIRPIMVVLTIPFTIITFGLFIFIINAAVIKMASGIVSGFYVDSWGTAILCGIIIALVSSLLERLIQSLERR